MTILILCFLGYLIWMLVEYRRHLLRLKKIPVRIHVNGTRGKSSVTRLIAAGLRGPERRVVAKTTGTLPRVIWPDGLESAIPRLGPPHISEQIKVVREAVREGADALVMECMALRPEVQWMSERQMVKATHLVFTNVQEDHLDVMGCDVSEVEKTLGNTMTRGGQVFCGSSENTAWLQDHAAEYGTEWVDEFETVEQEELDSFGYFEHASNVRLALEVCEKLGVERPVALERIRKVRPDVGVLRIFDPPKPGWPSLTSAFAANDPDSTRKVIQLLQKRGQFPEHPVFVLTHRPDRQFRTDQMVPFLRKEFSEIPLLLAGYGLRRINRQSHSNSNFQVVLWDDPEKLLETIMERFPQTDGIVGVGNIGGGGGVLMEYFNHATGGTPLLLPGEHWK